MVFFWGKLVTPESLLREGIPKGAKLKKVPYGKSGAYKDCEHYPEKSENFKACKSEKYNEIVWTGEATKKNLKKGLMRRLRYNPLWESMLKEIKNYFQFLKYRRIISLMTFHNFKFI